MFREIGWVFYLIIVLMGAVPTIFGMLVVLAGFLKMKDSHQRMRLIDTYPEKPWMWRKDWATGIVLSPNGQNGYSGAGGKIFSSLCYLCLFLFLLIPMSLVMFLSEDEGKGLSSTEITIVSVVGAVVLFFVFLRQFPFQKRRTSKFVLAQNPGEIGGVIKDEIQTNAPIKSLHGFKLVLYCRQLSVSSSGDVWEETKDIEQKAVESDKNSSVIPVEFTIPANVPATNYLDDLNHYTWRLTVESKSIRWFRYEMCFEVPVFDLGKGTWKELEKTENNE